MPANGRGLVLKAQATDSATENIPPGGFVHRVRVKRCGKSAPRLEQSGWQGKPHVEQDQIGEEERPAPLPLPGRLLEPVSNGRSRRMVAARFGGYRNRLTDRAGTSYSLSPLALTATSRAVLSTLLKDILAPAAETLSVPSDNGNAIADFRSGNSPRLRVAPGSLIVP